MERKSYTLINENGQSLGAFQTYECAMKYGEDTLFNESYSIRETENNTQNMWTEDEMISLIEGFLNMDDEQQFLQRYGCSINLLNRLVNVFPNNENND